MSNFAEDYVDVATRLHMFKEKHPEGSLQPVRPIEVITVGDKTFLSYVAAAYRTPDDPRPGIGTAWEPFPGRTPYTRDSEAMVVETSAWGRAIVAALAADTKRGVASANEIANRRAEDKPQAAPQSESPGVDLQAAAKWIDGFTAEVKNAGSVKALNEDLWPQLKAAQETGFLNSRQVKDLINTMGGRKQHLEAAEQQEEVS